MHQRGLHITTNYHMIKCWIEHRKGIPAVIIVGNRKYPTITFEYLPKVHQARIGWDEFFELITDLGLAFIYEEDHSDGSPAVFFKFVPWENYADEIREEERQENKLIIAQNCFS